MATSVLYFTVLGLFAATSNLVLAHDLGRGHHKGFPPSISESERQLLQLVPAGLNEATQAEMRGILDRAKMWPQNKELIICFLSGSPKARAHVAATAVEWANYVNLRFNFGDMLSPRTCSGNGTEHIKIDFKEDGYWSYVGIDSWQFEQSMNLEGFGGDSPSVDEEEYRGFVLHEFGHALGFAHEHQSPAAKCDAEFDYAQVEAWAKRMGWSADEIKTNLGRLQPTATLEFTRHDTKSIMHYSLPEEFFRDGRRNKCWVPKNNELSNGDKQFAASIYPSRVASYDGSNKSVRFGELQSQDSKELEANYRAELEHSFEQLLTKVNIKKSDREELGAMFIKRLAKLRDSP